MHQGNAKTNLVETAGSKFSAECKELYTTEQYADLLDRLRSKLDLLISKSRGEDLECCLNIICHLVPRIPTPLVVAAAQSLASELASNIESQPDKRLQTLIALYNVVQEREARLSVLLTAIRYSTSTPELADLMLPVIRHNAETWIADLATSPAVERELLKASSGALKVASRKPRTAAKESYRLLTRCLATYEKADPQEASFGKEVAASVVKDFIASPDLYHFDLFESPAVVHLASDSQYAPLYALLKIYLTGGVSDYKAFAAKNLGVLESVGVTEENALAKMRLLALMGLASDSASGNEVAFAELKGALELNEQEVEACVVQAIGKKIIEARIDQLRGVVQISKCTPRTFGKAEWQHLGSQLGGWAAIINRVRMLTVDENQTLPGRLAELSLKA